MFYCEPCRIENDWPDAITKSFGTCEMCDRRDLCHDRPTSSLPQDRSTPRQFVDHQPVFGPNDPSLPLTAKDAAKISYEFHLNDNELLEIHTMIRDAARLGMNEIEIGSFTGRHTVKILTDRGFKINQNPPNTNTISW